MPWSPPPSAAPILVAASVAMPVGHGSRANPKPPMKPTCSIARCVWHIWSAWCLLALGCGNLHAQDPTITRGPTNFWHSVSIGATVTNRVWVIGGYTYQWRLNGTPISWATNYSITLTNVQMADAGPYDVVVTDAVGASVTSDIDELEVNPMFIMITGSPVTTNNIGTWQAAWFDYDNDGYVDLLNGEDHPGRTARDASLYQNNGDGTFRKMTASEVGSLVSAPMASLGGCVWGDFDNDGDPDVWDNARANGGLHWNDGTGRFTQLNVGSLPSGFAGVTGLADYDNDGVLDLTMLGGDPLDLTTVRIQLHHNLGGTNFEEVAISAGIARFSANPPWTGGWGDYDNDGWQDLLCRPLWSPAEPGVLYRNLGDGTFESIDLGSPTYDWEADAGGGLWADYNNDGFLDLFMPHNNGNPHPNFLFRNNLPALGNRDHWLKVKLEGRVSNRAGIGAKVRVQATNGGRTLWQLREISGSSISGSDGPLLIAHFGLGDATNVTTLRIEWPSGIVQEFNDVAADQHLTIVEHEDYPTNALPAIASVSASTNGLSLTIQEPTAGAHYALEGSTDLQNWAMLLGRTSAGGTQSFTDTKTTNYPARFYRVIVP